MLIASWPLQEFAGFLQIISWITLPVLLVAVMSTVLVHYYQRRKRMSDPNNPAEMADLARSDASPHYDELKRDFENLQQAYRSGEEELGALNSEMKRQDYVIEQLRTDVTTLEKNLSTLKLALQLKEEQLNDLRHFVEESQVRGQSSFRPAAIAAEIS